LGRFFREICSKTLTRSDVKCLKNEIPEILLKIELIYPLAFFDVMVDGAVLTYQLGTPIGMCDEHNSKFSLSYETKV
jgi:hypothetical protein